MNRKLLTILLISFVIAGACAFLVYRIVGARMSAVEAGGDDARGCGGRRHQVGHRC